MNQSIPILGKSKMAASPKRIFFPMLLFIILCIVVFVTYSVINNCDVWNIRYPKNQDNIGMTTVKAGSKLTLDTIKIGTVICSKGENKGPREEAVVLMKSVVISSIVYNITNNIEFHLFIQHNEDETFFNSSLKKYSNPLSRSRKSLYFYSADDVVSKYYPEMMGIRERRLCMYARLFFPSVLNSTDAILYLDTDVIVTGDLRNLWNYFGPMTSEQLIGLTQNRAPNSPLKPDFFDGLPFIKPQGLNSGILLMNLTRMRKYRWEEKLLRLYDDYALKQNVILRSDQKLVNILLYFDSGIYLDLPCQFNFWYQWCDSGLLCDEVLRDTYGIQIVHGAGEGFEKGLPFHEFFMHYRNFSLNHETSLDNIRNDLIVLIRQEHTKNNSNDLAKHGKCDEAVSKYVFLN